MDMRLDSAETMFFEKELRQILAESFDVAYATLKGRGLVGTGELIDPGAETVSWEQYDFLGQAKLLSDFGDDVPMANATGLESAPVTMRSYALGYQYSIQELKAAAKAGKSLDRMRARAVRDGLAQKLDDIIATGDTSVGVKGLLNLTNTTSHTVASDGTGSSKLWVNKSGALMLRDMNAICKQIIVDTKEVESAKRLILPTSQFELAATTYVNDAGPNDTVLNAFKKMRPGVEVLSWERCAGSGSGATDRMVAYDPNPSKVRLLMATEFDQLPPQQKNFAFVVLSWMRTGGVINPFPKAMAYGDGI